MGLKLLEQQTAVKIKVLAKFIYIFHRYPNQKN